MGLTCHMSVIMDLYDADVITSKIHDSDGFIIRLWKNSIIRRANLGLIKSGASSQTFLPNS